LVLSVGDLKVDSKLSITIKGQIRSIHKKVGAQVLVELGRNLLRKRLVTVDRKFQLKARDVLHSDSAELPTCCKFPREHFRQRCRKPARIRPVRKIFETEDRNGWPRFAGSR